MRQLDKMGTLRVEARYYSRRRSVRSAFRPSAGASDPVPVKLREAARGVGFPLSRRPEPSDTEP